MKHFTFLLAIILYVQADKLIAQDYYQFRKEHSRNEGFFITPFLGRSITTYDVVSKRFAYGIKSEYIFKKYISASALFSNTEVQSRFYLSVGGYFPVSNKIGLGASVGLSKGSIKNFFAEYASTSSAFEVFYSAQAGIRITDRIEVSPQAIFFPDNIILSIGPRIKLSK